MRARSSSTRAIAACSITWPGSWRPRPTTRFATESAPSKLPKKHATRPKINRLTSSAPWPPATPRPATSTALYNGRKKPWSWTPSKRHSWPRSSRATNSKSHGGKPLHPAMPRTFRPRKDAANRLPRSTPPANKPGADLDREHAWQLVCEYTANESLRRHMRAVEAALRPYPRRYGEDEATWGIVGLLHDFDYERWPNAPDHPLKGAEILAARGYPDHVI